MTLVKTLIIMGGRYDILKNANACIVLLIFSLVHVQDAEGFNDLRTGVTDRSLSLNEAVSTLIELATQDSMPVGHY